MRSFSGEEPQKGGATYEIVASKLATRLKKAGILRGLPTWVVRGRMPTRKAWAAWSPDWRYLDCLRSNDSRKQARALLEYCSGPAFGRPLLREAEVEELLQAIGTETRVGGFYALTSRPLSQESWEERVRVYRSAKRRAKRRARVQQIRERIQRDLDRLALLAEW